MIKLTTYIFGHKSPDTDSVCSSIALSYLKNELGDKTEARVLGNINNETKFVLDYFKVSEPSYLNDVRIRIRNLKFDKKAYINELDSIDKAYRIMQKENITAIPLVDNKKKLSGFITLKELAKYLINGNRDYVKSTLDNIIDTLNAKVITKFNDEIEGKTIVVGMNHNTIEHDKILNEKSILITGDRYRLLEYAINAKVALIVLPLSLNIDKKIIKKAEKNKINIIASELDSFSIATKICLSNHVKNINVNKSPVTVNIDDCYNDFKTMTHQINHTNYPIINKKNECLGLIRLTGKAEYERHQVILVDHNNLQQSVDGIEEADILEIIDHHNLGAIGTPVPINFRSRPVGCTATMIYDLYKENKVTIPKNMAGIMLSAILSDTLLLTSPTTTESDRFTAIKLASIAKVDIDTYGLEMMRAASSIKGMSTTELIKSDFKSFTVNDYSIGIGQVMTMDFDTIKENMADFVSKLDEMCENSYKHVILFITDIIKNGSYIIYDSKSKKLVEDAFGIDDASQGYFLEGVVSRKKQMLPSILNVLNGDN